MTEKSSQNSKPGFFRGLGIAIVYVLVPLQTSLIVIYYGIHALSGSTFWFIDLLGFIFPLLLIPSLVLLPLALWHRVRKFTLLAVIPPAIFLLTYGHLYLPRLPVAATDTTFTVLTHNVFFGNTEVDQILGVIETNDPDVVALSELDSFVAQELVDRISNEYPYYRVDSQYGLYSRYPIQEYSTFEMSAGEWGSRLAQKCVLEIDDHRVTLLHAHPYTVPIVTKRLSLFGIPLGLPLDLENTYRDADIDGVLSQMAQVNGTLIVLGDFNLTDQQDGYKELTRGLLDAHRESGWGLGLTFTRFPQIGIPMWRIDYVFHSPDLVSLHTKVGDYGNSDHKPVIAKLAFGDE